MRRKSEAFNIKYGEWLEEDFDATQDSPGKSDKVRGRPAKSIGECSEYTRKRKLQEATGTIPTGHLSEALTMQYRREQERDKSDITKAVTVASPPRLKRMKASIPTPPNTDISRFTPDEGLALLKVCLRIQ